MKTTYHMFAGVGDYKYESCVISEKGKVYSMFWRDKQTRGDSIGLKFHKSVLDSWCTSHKHTTTNNIEEAHMFIGNLQFIDNL